MSTTMEYLNCSVDEGLVSKMLIQLGFGKSESGRWPSGLKVDTLRELVAALEADLELTTVIGAAVKVRQDTRPSGSSPRIARTPDSVLRAVESGHINADELMEVTPGALRVRKKELKSHLRERVARQAKFAVA